MRGYDLLVRLKELGYIRYSDDPYWWPRSGTFEVVVGAILTQNSRWERVEVALANLREFLGGQIDPQALVELDSRLLSQLIKPAGFYRTKAHRLQLLTQRILDRYGSFEAFQARPSRRWLLEQKGIGPESADAILNYGCYREFLVVDRYSAKLLGLFGYSFHHYDELQDFLAASLREHREAIAALYPAPIPLAQIYARFHGKIVEFCKDWCKGKGWQRRARSLLEGESLPDGG
ncbi:MAG: 3-methyladenine DNA glycosylase [Nitratiruptor sp.]|nr:3-methyladenine DNA glycosylase [Nitratiruptor sp.]NPA83781.1 3-methyladenine DNA glycosylase [Campylobacterota bacterium]